MQGCTLAQTLHHCRTVNTGDAHEYKQHTADIRAVHSHSGFCCLHGATLPVRQAFRVALHRREHRTMGSKLTDLWLQVGQTSVLLYSPWKWSTITESLLAR